MLTVADGKLVDLLARHPAWANEHYHAFESLAASISSEESNAAFGFWLPYSD